MVKNETKNNVIVVTKNDGKSVIDLNLQDKVYLMIDINNITNLKKLIKKIESITKEYDKDKFSLLIKSNGNKKLENDVMECINAALCKTKKEKIEYIYDTVCNYLDEEFKNNNYCDFKDDVCKAKRKCKDKKVTMGSCHEIKSLLKGKLKECPLLKDKKCSTKCITCKLFTCDAIEKKFKIKDIPLIDIYFNPIQKFIIKTSYFTKREVIIDKLLKW